MVEYEESIFHFGKDMNLSDVLERIHRFNTRNPWELAKTENLLAFGSRNPEEQRKDPIVALGAVGFIDGTQRVLVGHGYELQMRLRSFRYSKICRFLAVRKKR